MLSLLAVALLMIGCDNNITKPTPIQPLQSYVIPAHTCYFINEDGVFIEIPCASTAPAR